MDEICGIEAIYNTFGEKLYSVGCMRKTKTCTFSQGSGDMYSFKKCLETNVTHHCIQCCSTDVCNTEGCGEKGYPVSRGPVCYNCPVHTQSNACHSIDVCRVGEVCMFDSRREFGDMLFSSGCSDAHACKQGAAQRPTIIGRDLDDNKPHSINDIPRSLSEHYFRSCCESDLCNHACNKSTIEGACDSNPCEHGTCYDNNGAFLCVCNLGLSGKHCNVSISECTSNPCHYGQCYDVSNGYVCVCSHGYEGKQCDKIILSCASSPCIHGNCTNENDGYTCMCSQGYTGKNCESVILPCASNPCIHGNCTNENDGYTCMCSQGYTGKNCESVFIIASDCLDIMKMKQSNVSGVYNVTLWHSMTTVQVYCDMDTDHGGWTVFQRRFNGRVNFTRNFADYESGFGDIRGEFWLGLANIREMVSRGISELRLDLTASDGTTVYETFQNFAIGIQPNYTLHIDRGTGTAGDLQGLTYNNGQSFTTIDRDYRNCANKDRGGWWFDNCAYANLNGEYIKLGTKSLYYSGEGGMTYYSFQGYNSLKETKLMLRRV